MRAIHENRKRAGVVALAAVAIAAVVSPVSASSGKPPQECPPPAQTIVAAVSPQMQAKLVVHEKRLRAAVEARMAETVELDISLHEVANVDGIRALAVLDRAELDQVARDWAMLDRAELDRAARGWAVLDRYVDVVEPLQWQEDWHAFAEHEDEASPASHPVTAGIDLLVSGAKAPARAALAAQHLVEAFAKVTPRVVRALF